jgi:hypothetical protein
MKVVSLVFIFLLLAGCQKQICSDQPNSNLLEINIEVNRLEKSLFRSSNPEDVARFLEENEDMAQSMFHQEEYPNQEILANQIFMLIQNEAIDTLYQEADKAFDQPAFEKQMNLSLSWLKYYFPNASIPMVETVVTGFYNDLVISKEKIIIGLDFFIGENATFRPLDIPQYILNRYDQRYLVPSILKFYVADYVSSGDEETLLSEMIDYGKIYYLLGNIMPCTPDHLIIGYTPKEIMDVSAFQELIWSRIIEQDILYATDEFTKRKFIGERPNAIELGDECPGRIGAWIGWQVVKNYMDETGSTMQQLMANRNHHDIFSKSGYKPKNIR